MSIEREHKLYILFKIYTWLRLFLVLSLGLNVFQTAAIVRMGQIHDEIMSARVKVLEQKINSIEAILEAVSETIDKFEVLFLETTAYAPYDSRGSCNDGDPDHTSTGIRPNDKTLAVDPKVFPYGTRFLFPGGELRIAQDTGAAMRKRTVEVSRGTSQYYLVDRAVKTHQEAIEYGRRIVPALIRRDAVVYKSRK